jgi:hypothetical protein
MDKTLDWPARAQSTDPWHRLRWGVAGLLRTASRGLDRWAQQLAVVPATPSHEGVLEFHAEAGGTHGALYRNGQRVATLPGVARL